jgi:hypothetical protein
MMNMNAELCKVYQCSNPRCLAIWNADPKGHCPNCITKEGVGYSTIPLPLLSLTIFRAGRPRNAT